MDPLIADTASRIFSDHVDKALLDRAEDGEFPADLWRVLRDAGLETVGSEGSGTELADAIALLKVAGRHVVPIPLAEILIAGHVLGADDGRFTTVAGPDGLAPWARMAERVLTVDGRVGTAFTAAPGANLAGEPRDRVELTDTEAVKMPPHALELMAMTRAALAAGALERLLELAVAYATERTQFGRPIAGFQAIQHQLAVMAGEVAAASRACDGAVQAIGGEHFPQQAAAAKARVGEASGIAAEIAHQVHGAMGFTHEHLLHHVTRRVWAWRDEYGNETVWQRRLGEHLTAAGADRLWDFITRAG